MVGAYVLIRTVVCCLVLLLINASLAQLTFLKLRFSVAQVFAILIERNNRYHQPSGHVF
jgi:hypothetical protein